MEHLQVRTRENVSAQGKPRVYFTCHPQDFDRYFDKICEDIFKSHDCAVYYAEDMAEPLPEEIRTVDLERMNLFVIPVTFSLLSSPCRAMDEDFTFARDRHIPVLPLMMESGIVELYSRPDRFGRIQFLSPYSNDTTEIQYEEKLKRYLESVLISDEMTERVRAAFDAYIFLSYRKKDRKYANELMRLIHSNPLCRDIAIWYDEFLTPGESFSDAIRAALDKSELFALLVTPNLVNEPNYVQAVEYPAAIEAGKTILPAEMVETDRDELVRQYAGLPECVNAREDTSFRERLVETLGRIAVQENDNDPAHNYLIGLAYMDGIDVEVDRERGVSLIIGAAEAGLPEAMKKLRDMYSDGTGVPLDYKDALKWSQRLADCSRRNFGEEHPDTLWALCALGYAYMNVGDYQRALETNEKVYDLTRKAYGEEDPKSLVILNNLAESYGKSGDYEKERKLQEKAYDLMCRTLGEEDPQSLLVLDNLALSYSYLGNFQRAAELQEKAYALECKVLGSEHPNTIRTMNNLAYSYGGLGDCLHEKELYEKAYDICRRVLGEEHPDTIGTLGNLASSYALLCDYEKGRELNEKVYALQCRVLGEEHPYNIETLNNLAYSYGGLGDRRREKELYEKAYGMCRRVLGDEHPNTLVTLDNLAKTHCELGDYAEAAEMFKTVYALRGKIFGENHPNTLKARDDLALAYERSGQPEKAAALRENSHGSRGGIINRLRKTLESFSFAARRNS